MNNKLHFKYNVSIEEEGLRRAYGRMIRSVTCEVLLDKDCFVFKPQRGHTIRVGDRS